MEGCGDLSDFEIRMRTDAGSADIDCRVFEIFDLPAFFADKVVVRFAVYFKEQYVCVVFNTRNQFKRFELCKVSVNCREADFRMDFADSTVDLRRFKVPPVVFQDFENRVALRTVSWLFCHGLA